MSTTQYQFCQYFIHIPYIVLYYYTIINSNNLHRKITAKDFKLARTGINHYYDEVTLIKDTINMFDIHDQSPDIKKIKI